MQGDVEPRKRGDINQLGMPGTTLDFNLNPRFGSRELWRRNFLRNGSWEWVLAGWDSWSPMKWRKESRRSSWVGSGQTIHPHCVPIICRFVYSQCSQVPHTAPNWVKNSPLPRRSKGKDWSPKSSISSKALARALVWGVTPYCITPPRIIDLRAGTRVVKYS